ncbi:NAD-dependent epimerase/dehydratase family protein [bacterium]|nr:NAD-dependent epimerase/dehydratase family protein [bacterium]
MKALVTGATGFVGSYLTRELLRNDDEVAILTRPGSSLRRLADVQDRITIFDQGFQGPEVVDVIQSYRPDCCFHLAWSGVAGKDRNELFQIEDNLEPSLNLIRQCADAGCETFVGLGSQAEYGPINRKAKESDPVNPSTLYGKTKWAVSQLGQAEAESRGMRFVWGRLFSSYGPGDNSDWLIPYLMRSLLAGQRPSLTPCEQIWDFIHVADVATALRALAVEPSAQGTFNVGGGDARPLREIVEAIRDLIDPQLPLGIGDVGYRPDQVMHLEADIERITTTTGWCPQVDLKTGLAGCLEELKDHEKTLPAMR